MPLHRSCTATSRPKAAAAAPRAADRAAAPRLAARRRRTARQAPAAAAAAGEHQQQHLRPTTALPCAEQRQQQQQQPPGGGLAGASCSCGVVVVDHGSRRRASNDTLVEFCRLYQQVTQQPIVQPAHMEIAEPTIEQAIAACVKAGATRVVVAPYFLSRGRHIQEDIPALVAEAQARFPDVPCSIAEPIGIDLLMVQLIQNRVRAVLSQECPAAAAAADGGIGGGSSKGRPTDAAAQPALVPAACCGSKG